MVNYTIPILYYTYDANYIYIETNRDESAQKRQTFNEAGYIHIIALCSM